MSSYFKLIAETIYCRKFIAALFFEQIQLTQWFILKYLLVQMNSCQFWRESLNENFIP